MTTEQDPLNTHLQQLTEAFTAHDEFVTLTLDREHELHLNAAWQAGLKEAKRQAASLGRRAVRQLVGVPGFADVARDQTAEAVDKDPEIVDFRQRWLGGEDTDAAVVKAAEAMAESLRLAAPIGHTAAIGWGMDLEFGVRTYGDLIAFFAARKDETPAEARAQTRPTVTLDAESARISMGGEIIEAPYYQSTAEPAVVAVQEGSPITIREARRDVTGRVLEWFGEHPGEVLNSATFVAIARTVIGNDVHRAFLVYRNIRDWWSGKLLTPAGEPVIQRVETEGESDKPGFVLHPSFLTSPVEAEAKAI